jgi:hypothetical protein
MKNYYVTVEGLVSRVMCVEADNVAKAMECGPRLISKAQ